MRRQTLHWCLVFLLLLTLPLISTALTLPLPPQKNDIVGENILLRPSKNVDLGDIGQRFGVGVYEMMEANGTPSPRYVRASRIVVPRQFILPSVREGIVINLAELRLYYFPPGESVVMTYPIGIGRVGWETPTGTTQVIQKTANPDWRPTQAIREETWRRDGIILPDVVPAGPNNPLGQYALRLGFHQYLIHGTNMPQGVGRRVSSGCIRMHNRDVEELFDLVSVGTKVTIINQPYKVGWQGRKLFIESHRPLSDDSRYAQQDNSAALEAITQVLQQQSASVNWRKVKTVSRQQSGIPQEVGFR
jgi:L,D-transpeptidase ErfK/SrfK